MIIPRWVYKRIQEICQHIVGDDAKAIKRRDVLRQFLTDIWLNVNLNTEDGKVGWAICTLRDIRQHYGLLVADSCFRIDGKKKRGTLLDMLSYVAPDVQHMKGRANQDPKQRKSGHWRFNPKRPDSDIDHLRLVDAKSGAKSSVEKALKSNGRASAHEFTLFSKSQYVLKQQEKAWLKGVIRGRMHKNFIKALRKCKNEYHVRAGILSLNHLFNARREGDYITYDHTYRLTFGGRYYDRVFQNLPNKLKSTFRKGLLNYDIKACNLACLNVLFKRYGVDYSVSSSIYAKMMKKTGLTRKQCKRLVHTTSFRIGRVTHGVTNGLGEAIYEWFEEDRRAALKLLRWWDGYVTPLRNALNDLLERIHEQHKKTCASPRCYHLYPNDIGIILDLKDESFDREKEHHQQYARDKSLLAHMTFGVEQAYIREVIRLNPGKICMLDHDGLVAVEEITSPEMDGFTLEIKP
jgi:hypothetical protein